MAARADRRDGSDLIAAESLADSDGDLRQIEETVRAAGLARAVRIFV